jgi:hypothetical protein
MKQINIGGHHFDVHWFSGRVLRGTIKKVETDVQWVGGGNPELDDFNQPLTPITTTTIHDQLFLAGADGSEKAFQLKNFDIACRESNEVTVFWAMKTGMHTGEYVLVRNHTTQDFRFQDSALGKLVGPSMLGCSGVALVLMLVPIILLIIGFLYGTLAGLANAVDPGGAGLTAIIVPLIFTVAAFIGFILAIAGPLIWHVRRTGKRVALFKAALNSPEFEGV